MKKSSKKNIEIISYHLLSIFTLLIILFPNWSGVHSLLEELVIIIFKLLAAFWVMWTIIKR